MPRRQTLADDTSPAAIVYRRCRPIYDNIGEYLHGNFATDDEPFRQQS
jgi:hypothetical protein